MTHCRTLRDYCFNDVDEARDDIPGLQGRQLAWCRCSHLKNEQQNLSHRPHCRERVQHEY
jgi:hypothetical protein